MRMTRHVLTSVLAGISLVASAAVGLSPSGAAHASGESAPSTTWQSYVLAPHDHTMQPASVYRADPRDGQIIGDPGATLPGGHGSVRLQSTGGRAGSPLLTLDFGQEVAGRIRVDVLDASQPRPQLHICYSESTRFMAVQPGQNGGETAYAPGCDTANIPGGTPGSAYTWDADSHQLPLTDAALPTTLTDPQIRGGFRYATFFLDGPGWVDLSHVSMQFTAVPGEKHPDAYQGNFLSSDDQLNRIWYAGAYTVQIDTTAADTGKAWPYQQGQPDTADAQVPFAAPGDEVIFDGGKRDRDVWEGDLAVEAPVAYLSTGDVASVRNSLVALASKQMPDGFVPPRSRNAGDTYGDDTFSGEYQTWFINNMATYYLYTGDRTFLQKWYPAIVRALGWLEGVRQQDPGGLIAFGSGPACGTYGYSDCGHGTYVNSLYVRNLRQVAGLAAALGYDADASVYRARAAEVAAAINSQLWDPAAGAYRQSRELPDVYPQDANVTAVLTGVADQDQARSSLAYLRAHNWSTYGSLMVPPGTAGDIPSHYEPFPSGFEVDARFATKGDTDSALALMRTYWGYQLTQDPGSTFWEKTDLNGQPAIGSFTSLAHGWASEPTTSLTTQVLGVQPTAPGFSRYLVQPHPADLRWAKGSVPTPHGAIRVHWTQHADAMDLTVSAPPGTQGRIAIPVTATANQVTLDGHVVWARSGPSSADLQDGYVVVTGLPAGTHRLAATTG